MNLKNLFRWLTIIVTFAPGSADAQTYHYAARLDSVAQSAFYAIAVTPLLSAQVETDFRDLRIKDSSGVAVPYLMESAIPQFYDAQFSAMPLLRNVIDDSGNNVIVFKNPQKARIQSFRFLFENAAVSRTIDLAGGNDSNRWYSVVENVDLARRFIQDSDHFSEQFSIPLSSYEYFRVIIRNRKSSPLKLLSVDRMISARNTTMPVLVKNPGLTFNSKDSNKVTTITVNNLFQFHISHLMLRVKSPRFFRRDAVCFSGARQLGNFVFSSDSVIHFSLPVTNDSVILVRIYNEDNPPLQVTAIETWQYPEKMIAYLEAGRRYRLEMNSIDAPVPRYDLLHFKDSIPAAPADLAYAEILPLQKSPIVSEKENPNGWLWPCLTFVLIVLGLSVYQLTKDMAAKKTE